jgi:hypothetical protein
MSCWQTGMILPQREKTQSKLEPKIEAGRRFREWKDFPEPPARWTLKRVWVVLLV